MFIKKLLFKKQEFLFKKKFQKYLDLHVPQRIPKILKNRYVLVLITFFVYVTFFDAHDLISQMKIRYELYKLNEQKEYLIEDTKSAKAQTTELTTNKASLEKFAREQYKMKRKNEEVFVIIEATSEP